LVLAYLDAGGHLLVLGEAAANLPDDSRRSILDHRRTTRRGGDHAFDPRDLDGGPQLRASDPASLAVNVQRVAAGAALHLIRYDYDEAADRVPPLPALTLDLRLPGSFGAASAFAPDSPPAVSLAASGEWHRLELWDVPLYSVVLLESPAESPPR
jgi:hypothetical protein